MNPVVLLFPYITADVPITPEGWKRGTRFRGSYQVDGTR